METFFFIILVHLIVATPQINLYFTDVINESADITQHNCLRMAASIDESNVSRQIISYCITESLSRYNIQKTGQFLNFTFTQLSKQNITSEQLYLWSAPIDLIEDYQYYLITNDSSLESKIFYNCSFPRFGPLCEYEFAYYHLNYSSFYEFIYDFYYTYKYQPHNFTCYKHLECDRGPFPSCLDWSEICDGKQDCRNNKFDEEYCWLLEINECNDNEYRCANGQCIPQSFYLDDYNNPDCLDQSDEHRQYVETFQKCLTNEPSFGCEDITCQNIPLTSSCLKQRTELLIEALYSIQDDSILNDCWTMFKCVTNMPFLYDQDCYNFCQNKSYIKIIEETCFDMLFIPTVPVLFSDIDFAYRKNDSKQLDCGKFCFPYNYML